MEKKNKNKNQQQYTQIKKESRGGRKRNNCKPAQTCTTNRRQRLSAYARIWRIYAVAVANHRVGENVYHDKKFLCDFSLYM